MNQVQGVYLNHFKSSEFRGWKMSIRLLCFLDLFRERLGLPVHISPVKGAIGRDGNGTSQHFWENWDEVRAIDVLPEGLTKENAKDYITLAQECGFKGVGIYPHWDPSPGMHLDVRDDSFTTWAGIDKLQKGVVIQEYVSVDYAILMAWENKL